MSQWLRFFHAIFLISLLHPGSTNGQALKRNLGDIIVRFSDDHAAAGFLDNPLQEIRTKDQQVTIKRLAHQLPIYLIHVDHTTVNDVALLAELKRLPSVLDAQLNHRLNLRNKVPNDPEITQQWYWINQGQFGGTENADVDADLAWEYTTGGVTPQGDSIVIAIVDDGIQLGHIDLQENLWTNPREVPDNGVDDDGNGYIDDYHGWNINDNGQIGDGQHGISVSGVAGAVGNNNLGISGINWEVKIMAVTLNFPNINEADVLTAYSYILDQRTAYNASKGEEGAFIVAVNSSWGIDRGRPRDAPLWCDFYDAMGAAGILNCAATATNANINVDRDGDLPTTCPSEFLISVTASDIHDGLASGAGFGPNHVDVAAPGVDIITTGFNNSFVLESGTSYSSPLVAGLIGLLYSTPCAGLTQNSTSDPMGTAAAVRDLVYLGTEQLESFNGLVRTNGRINAYNSMIHALTTCVSCAPAFKLEGEVSDTSATLTWEIVDSAATSNIIYRSAGTETFDTMSGVTSPFTIENLQACTDYEIGIQAVCSDTSRSDFEFIELKTDGCCDPPDSISVIFVGRDSAIIGWPAVLAAEGYMIRMKRSDSTDWQLMSVPQNQYVFTELERCISYDLQLQTLCDSGRSELSEVFSFMTTGCSLCDVEAYCRSFGLDTEFDWIDSISLSNVQWQSGNDGGYADFTFEPELSPVLNENERYSISLTPSPGSRGYFKVWIDWNMDRALSGGELVGSTNTPVDSTVAFSFFVPNVDTFAHTLMRVSYQWFGFGLQPGACDTLQIGEVEDYCVVIEQSLDVCQEIANEEIETRTDAILITWDSVPRSLGYLVRSKEASQSDWEEEMVRLDTFYMLDGLKTCTEYDLEIRTVCERDTSNFKRFTIMTRGEDCTTAKAIISQVRRIGILPNPFAHSFAVRIELDEPVELAASLTDLRGRTIRHIPTRHFNAGEHILEFEGSALPSGMYLMHLRAPTGQITRKIIKY